MMIDQLSRKLGYQFKNPELLNLALTHRSYADTNNERLEFLGDSIVNFVIAEALYHQFPHAQEGHLSRWRATLINRDTIGDLARQFELGRYLNLGPGELKSGGSDRQSILSCAMEAIIGAIYLDGGFEAIKNCIMHWYENLLDAISYEKNQKDPKTQLQEYLQSQHMTLPVYAVESIEGEAHQQAFVVSCTVDTIEEKAIGKGTSRRRAEQEAASVMLRRVKK
jgi:ribonuclease-3